VCVCVCFGGVFRLWRFRVVSFLLPSFFLSFFLSFFPWNGPCFPFYRRKGSTGLQVMFLREKRSEISGPIVGGILLLEEWTSSSDAAVTCPDRHSPTATKCRIVIITVVTCLSLWFDRRREPRPRWCESWRDFTTLEGTVV
jgi:hypothetical protein